MAEMKVKISLTFTSFTPLGISPGVFMVMQFQKLLQTLEQGYCRLRNIASCRNLESSQPGIFAAGDVCSLNEDGQSFHFFQMRLWTQVHSCVLSRGALKLFYEASLNLYMSPGQPWEMRMHYRYTASFQKCDWNDFCIESRFVEGKKLRRSETYFQP